MTDDARAEVAARYRAILATYLSRVDAIPPDAWALPTPCEEWDVRDLVAHSVAVHRRMLARLNGTEVPGLEPEPARPGEDLGAEVWALAALVLAALDDAVLGARVVESPVEAMPFHALVGTFLCGDTLIHTWDVSRATGQDERLDPAAVDVTLGLMRPRDEFMRTPGRFGSKLETLAGADPQTELLHFCGRKV